MSVVRLFAMIGIAATLSGCGGFSARLNPFTWFGPSEPRETIVLPDEQADARLLVAEVLSLNVEQIPGGAIIRAEGRTPTQGWWDAELVPQEVGEDGRLVLDFRIFPPIERADVSTPQSRQVAVAIYLSDIRLAPVREIVVQGAGNARATRR